MRLQEPILPFTTVIMDLYNEARVPLPSPRQPITPLGELVGSYNLTWVELPGLTGQSAVNFLLQRGAVIDEPKQMPQEPLAGFLYAYADFGCIFVESGDVLVRRRFSVAHELGHYLLHFRPLLTDGGANGNLILIETAPRTSQEPEFNDLPMGSIKFNGADQALKPPLTDEQMERQANQFAAELLMPADLLQELVGFYTPHFQGDDLIWRLATDLLVSKLAMRWRLRTLGITFAGNEA